MWNKPTKGESRLMLLSLLVGGFSGYSLSKKYNTNLIVGSIVGGITGLFVLTTIGRKIKLDRVLDMGDMEKQSGTNIQSSVQPTPIM